MAFVPTPEQEAAINGSGSLIVSAAAGSGKTAVLVERVMRLLTDPINPVSADKLLVVTYTNAAAAELRSRIEKRLSELLESSPTNPLLKRQSILINSAKICTIDSFCINFIRDNFETSKVNPTFKIAERAVIDSLQNTAMSELINYHFDLKDDNFIDLLGFVGDDYSDSNLRSIIQNIFDYSRQIPFPNNWLDKIANQYTLHANKSSDEWFCDSMEIVLDFAEEARLDLEQANLLLLCNQDAYKKYSANYLYFYDLAHQIDAAARLTDWDTIYNLLKNQSAPKLSRLKPEEKTPEVSSSVDFRDSAKSSLKKISQIIYAPKAEIIKQIEFVLPYVKQIIGLVKEFEERLYKLFRDKNYMTFYMAEQTTFEMLAAIDNGNIVLSDDAQEFINQFEAVLVDEYQDTNTLQDLLFGILSNNEKNLFCVGDVKQSIYRFRGSNPVNFIKKKTEYADDNAGKTRIDLSSNFRSRPEICEYINNLFGKLIYNKNSGFDYDDKEKLDARAVFPKNTELKVENHFLDFNAVTEDSDEEFDAKISAEAELVANLVAETVNKEAFLRDGDSLRPAEYKDITILVRSMQSKGDYYINALKNRGIPVSVAASDVIGSDEVCTLLSILKIINNPSDDVALLTIMTSPIFAFSMDELAQIRSLHKYGKMISAVVVAARAGNKKAEEFLNIIDTLRYKNIVLSVGQLIEEIFEKTNLLNILSLGPNGEVKRLNLLGILNVANQFETEGRRDLLSFINYFSEIQNKDFKLSATGSSNSVTIMSIHKSKGLQFPVCILANTSNRFNLTDVSGTQAISEKYGFSTTYIDNEGMKIDDFILKSLMKYDEKKQLLAEELRVCYVAMTRAEEKLIVVSSFNDLDSEIAKKKNQLDVSASKELINFSLFSKNNSYADWILESLLLDGKEEGFYNNIDPSIIVHKSISKNSIEEEEIIVEIDSESVEKLKQNYEYKYPYSELLDIEAKASVTDIVHKADLEKYVFTKRPSFMHTKGLSAAEKGTAIHKVMQYADFSACSIDIDKELERLYEYGYLTDSEYDAIDSKYLTNFFSSNLCRRILASNLVKREMKFITEFPVTMISDEIPDKFADEKIIVQGAVDLLFVEDGKIVIVDFKSDTNKNESDLVAAYSEQLKIYAKACSKILKLPVGEMIIYSFSLDKSINI